MGGPWPASGSEALTAAVLGGAASGHDLLQVVTITPTVLLTQLRIQGTYPNYQDKNWIKDLPSLALLTRARSSFPHSQFLPSGSFHKPLTLIHQRADRMKTTVTEN